VPAKPEDHFDAQPFQIIDKQVGGDPLLCDSRLRSLALNRCHYIRRHDFPSQTARAYSIPRRPANIISVTSM
jgi:hypothetical protein